MKSHVHVRHTQLHVHYCAEDQPRAQKEFGWMIESTLARCVIWAACVCA